jgi:hypothetical protein
MFNLVSNPITLTAIATALAATLISPFVSVYVARRQIRAALVSANRQAWINALRDDLSELFDVLEGLFVLRPGTLSAEEEIKYWMEKNSRTRLLTNRIRLRLNPEEKPSNMLLALIGQLRAISFQQAGARDEFEQVMESAVSRTQEILKAEWRRVKAGR